MQRKKHHEYYTRWHEKTKTQLVSLAMERSCLWGQALCIIDTEGTHTPLCQCQCKGYELGGYIGVIAHDAHVALVTTTTATERYTEEYVDRLGKDFTWGWGHLQ